ncbi:MarR family transcriptional regulator [Paenibacillus zeisoli]|uniref:MarR family transcriptional regulator n=1 Tax=Paenibacillus zeisoli TaxID=2496267 RepID=A0A3S1D2Z6_9BACL|nr:MarR family transcriptional regulator [Paenibacillus zeisoli]RUT35821.1 MarR family transcriptional regulator [Paenibacillus zeisoli]
MFFHAADREKQPSARVSMTLFRVSQSVKKITQMESDAVGLSPVQVHALLFAGQTREDMATVGHFARAIGASHVTAVKIVNGLVVKGLLDKLQHPGDRRSTIIRLTAAGKQQVEALERWGEALERTIASLPAEALSMLELGLGAVITALQREGYLTVAEPCRGCVNFRPNTGSDDKPHYCTALQNYLSHEASLKECPEHQSPTD